MPNINTTGLVLETTEEERAGYVMAAHGAIYRKLIRDLDRALAEVSRLTQATIKAQADRAELRAEVSRLTGEREGLVCEEREALLRDIQAMRKQYAPLEEGEAVMLDSLQDRVERREGCDAYGKVSSKD